MTIPRFPATASGAEVAAALHSDGCAVVERLVPRALLDQAHSELQPYLEATPFGPDEFAWWLLRLMGYARGAYALGYVDDMRDPLDVLLQRRSGVGLGELSAASVRIHAEA